MDINKIYNMDCFLGMKQMEDNSVDMILTDPPYNTGMQSNENTKKGDRVRLSHFFDDYYSDDNYKKFVISSCRQFSRLLKNDKCGYIFINWKSLGLWMNCLKFYGFEVKNVIVWDKVIHGLNWMNYAYTYELIIFFTKGNYLPNNKVDGYYKDIWKISRGKPSESEFHHETEKVIEVCRIPIKHGSKEGDIILDPFVGGGNIILACRQLKRQYIGFEIVKSYVDICNKKLSQTLI